MYYAWSNIIIERSDFLVMKILIAFVFCMIVSSVTFAQGGVTTENQDTAITTTVKETMLKPRKKPVQQKTVVNNQPIPRNMALSLAINEAPPANDFQIFKNYQGDIPIYQVLFHTDNGFYEVQIDAFEGIIIQSGYRDDLNEHTPKAGYLPRKWQ